MKLRFKGLSDEILKGINEISAESGFVVSEDGFLVNVSVSDEKNIKIIKTKEQADVFVPEEGLIFRSLMHILSNSEEEYTYSEPVVFEQRGAMFDMAQGNCAMTVEALKKLFKYSAKMGYNYFMVYVEDNYDIDGEPYFGYMRARYTSEEFKELDNYAKTLGLELIPCIQTLGHLMEALKRSYPYGDYKDQDHTLLVGDDRTYVLIDKMIKTMSECITSRKIHIGMDEAWGLGLGKYLARNGYVDRSKIMKEHLERVSKILEKYDYEAIMWGDMFFRSHSKTGDYFDLNVELSERDKEALPHNITPIYWDYYNPYDICVKMLSEFKKISEDVVFAGCSRNVRTFGAHHARSVYATNVAMKACKEFNVKNVFTTSWGDDNRESSAFGILAAMAHFAEHCFTYEEATEEAAAKNFKAITGLEYADFVKISKLDEVDGYNSPNLKSLSPSKVCMWQDIMLGMVDENLNGFDFSMHYKNLAADFKKISESDTTFSGMFDFYYNIANVLEIKANIGVRITKAYKEKDIEFLKKVSGEILPELQNRVKSLRLSHKNHGLSIYKPIGWMEVMDIRYGGLIMRIDTAIARINDFVTGKISKIEELEEQRLRYDNAELVPDVAFYKDLCSASRISC